MRERYIEIETERKEREREKLEERVREYQLQERSVKMSVLELNYLKPLIVKKFLKCCLRFLK